MTAAELFGGWLALPNTVRRGAGSANHPMLVPNETEHAYSGSQGQHKTTFSMSHSSIHLKYNFGQTPGTRGYLGIIRMQDKEAVERYYRMQKSTNFRLN